MKKLYRSKNDAMITGVCGGLADFLKMDATVIRLIWMLIVIFTGFFPGLLAYIIAALIMPLEPEANNPITPQQ